MQKNIFKPSVWTMLFFGFSAGIPVLLIFSSLSLWLREAGVDRSSVTFFSWAALGYSFKFVWAPLVDRLPLPFLNSFFGRRRSWIFLSQIFIMIAIAWMGFTDPLSSSSSLTAMALAAVLLGFSSATQDIAIDAYRIESDSVEMQALLSSMYITGYRIAMIVAGAGALYLAEFLGSSAENYSYQAWKWTYLVMSLTMLVGILTTFFAKEPENKKISLNVHSTLDYCRFLILFVSVTSSFVLFFYLSYPIFEQLKLNLTPLLGAVFSGFLMETFKFMGALGFSILTAFTVLKLKISNTKMAQETYVAPIKDFFSRYDLSIALMILLFIGLYRISDILLGVISNVFYQDMGFSKEVIAGVVKTFGLVMTIVGSFLGGFITKNLGVFKVLFLGGVLASGTNILFMLLSESGSNLPMLYFVISADNLAAGLSSAAFIAFLSSLTNISFTAIQYAIFSSLMTLFPKVLGGYSGSIVDSIGYTSFFILSTVLGIPVLLILWFYKDKIFEIKKHS